MQLFILFSVLVVFKKQKNKKYHLVHLQCGDVDLEPKKENFHFLFSVFHQLNEEIKFKVNFALVKQRQTQTYKKKILEI